MKKTIKITKDELRDMIQQIHDAECEYQIKKNPALKTALEVVDDLWNSKTNYRKLESIKLPYRKLIGISIVVTEKARELIHYGINPMLDNLTEEIWNKERNRQ